MVAKLYRQIGQLIYLVAKEVADSTAVLGGKVDAIALTGSMGYSRRCWTA